MGTEFALPFYGVKLAGLFFNCVIILWLNYICML